MNSPPNINRMAHREKTLGETAPVTAAYTNGDIKTQKQTDKNRKPLKEDLKDGGKVILFAKYIYIAYWQIKCLTDPISIRYPTLSGVPVVDDARRKENAAQNQQNSQYANRPIGEADKETDKKRPLRFPAKAL
jgi:hypothetical protein